MHITLHQSSMNQSFDINKSLDINQSLEINQSNHWHQSQHDPKFLTWGTTLRSEKVIFSLSKQLWTEKNPLSRFNHLSIASTSLNPSNNGIHKFICTCNIPNIKSMHNINKMLEMAE
jgi:hypothetical protein